MLSPSREADPVNGETRGDQGSQTTDRDGETLASVRLRLDTWGALTHRDLGQRWHSVLSHGKMGPEATSVLPVVIAKHHNNDKEVILFIREMYV